MRKRLVCLALAATLGLATLPALSLTAPAYAATDTAAKPKRERSEAQKKNDQIMRDCGAEYRTKDAAFKKANKWVNFLKECRTRKKT